MQIGYVIQELLSMYKGYHFWYRKVFEGVQKHVINLLRKPSFGAEHYFDFAPKVLIRTIYNAPKLQFNM